MDGARQGWRRRQVLLGTVGLAASAALPRIAIAETRAPLRIGFLNTFSKGSAFSGESSYNGFMLYLEQNGNSIAGRKVEVIREDDEFNPQVGLEKIKKLVERDKVDLVVGPQGSNVAMALLPYLRQSKTFLVCNGAGTSALTRQKGLPYLFRTSLSTWQVSSPMADWIYDNLAKEIVLTGSDYAGGHDVVDDFKAQFVKRGGKVIKEIYPPIGTNDYSAYLADIRSIAPPATYNFYSGADAVRFVKQYADFGLRDKIPLTGYASLVDTDTIGSQGDAAYGTITGNIYAGSLETSANKAFTAAYRAKYNDEANLYSDYGYNASRVVAEAVKGTDGDTSKKDRLAEAMLKVSFEDPRGPFRFDPTTHNPIQNLYILKAVQVDGKYAAQVLKTLPDVRDPGKA